MKDWFGKVKGHVGEAKSRFAADAKQRQDAEASAQSTILSDSMLRSGQWDAGKVLFTTLNGGLTAITGDDLARFRRNMTLAKKQAGFKGGGITARQVIDLAAANPLKYRTEQPRDAASDLDKARREITSGVPVSARNEVVRFITNAGAGSDVSRHHVTVEFAGFRAAADEIVAAGDASNAAKRAANKMRKGALKFDCDCGRHRFFLRYVATIGGFNAGRPETGFPKIRNPGLKGVACKHVLRVMTELESSNFVLGFLERHLKGASAYKANTTTKQADAQEAAQSKRPSNIKTSAQRMAEAAKAREKRAMASAAKSAAARPPKRSAPTSRRASLAAKALGEQFNLSPEQVLAILAQASKKG